MQRKRELPFLLKKKQKNISARGYWRADTRAPRTKVFCGAYFQKSDRLLFEPSHALAIAAP
jgi:hypothetical protein